MKELINYDKVFFVHYQCDDFNEGEQITTLGIHSKGRATDYKGNEIENLKDYASLVNELLSEGLTLVHWNQDRPNYGTDHINKRYKDLTGENLELEYSTKINLAAWLWEKYGDDYAEHPRLDSLAKMNNFNGIRENELGQNIYAVNRLLLLSKIYHKAFAGTLKTNITAAAGQGLPPNTNEVLSEQITHAKKVEISNAIKEKYSAYKGKDFKILYEALLKLDLFPPKGKRTLFFRCLKNEGYNINNSQMLEDIHFKDGSNSGQGKYLPSDDEKQRDGIVKYLETITNPK